MRLLVNPINYIKFYNHKDKDLIRRSKEIKGSKFTIRSSLQCFYILHLDLLLLLTSPDLQIASSVSMMRSAWLQIPLAQLTMQFLNSLLINSYTGHTCSHPSSTLATLTRSNQHVQHTWLIQVDRAFDGLLCSYEDIK